MALPLRRYLNLSSLAIDILRTTALNCECENLFSKLSGLPEPQWRNVSFELLAVLNCVKCWSVSRAETPQERQTAAYTDDEIDIKYHVKGREIEAW